MMDSTFKSQYDLSSVGNGSVVTLAWMMFLVPALGVPSELMLQDTLKSALVAFGVLIAALQFVWQRRSPIRPTNNIFIWHGLIWLPLALMAYALGSMVWSHTYLAGVEAIRWFLISLLVWLVLNTLTWKNLPALLWGMHCGAVAASLWTLMQFWFDLSIFPQGASPGSTFVNRNFFAEYAVSVLPFSVYLLATSKAARRLPWMALSVTLQGVAILTTGTRSALIALVVLVPVGAVAIARYRKALAFSQWHPSTKVWVSLIIVGGVFGLGSLPSHSPWVAQQGNGTTALERSFLRLGSIAKPVEYASGSFSIRSTMWKATARMTQANPWTGVGAGAWEVQIPLYQRIDTMVETDYYAHNEFIQLLSEYGVVVGGLVLAFLFAYLLLAADTTWRLKGTAEQEAPLRAFTLISLLGLIIVSNGGFPWHLAATGALLAVYLGILAGSDFRLPQERSFFGQLIGYSRNAQRATITVLLCCVTIAAYITQQAALVEYKLMSAIQMANRLMKDPVGDAAVRAQRMGQLLQNVREGVAINPHYRRLTAELSGPLAAGDNWGDVVWILESVAASRPNVAAIWVGLAMGYTHLAQYDRAQVALAHVQTLKPNAPSTRTLEIILLDLAGTTGQAVSLLNAYFDKGEFDYDMVQTAYALGYKTQHWALAIRSQQLRVVTWPEHAADGYFRLGNLYTEPGVQDNNKALAAFTAGLRAVPEAQKENYRQQVPLAFRSQM